jgi:site-specific recombinase XerD
MTNEIGQFLDYLTFERNVSVNTVTAYRDDLESFLSFLCNDYLSMARDQIDLRRVDHLTIRAYLAHLSRRKLSRSSTARHLSALRTFFRFLVREGVVDANPARAVATPKKSAPLPGVLQTSEVARSRFFSSRPTSRLRWAFAIKPGSSCSMRQACASASSSPSTSMISSFAPGW